MLQQVGVTVMVLITIIRIGLELMSVVICTTFVHV